MVVITENGRLCGETGGGWGTLIQSDTNAMASGWRAIEHRACFIVVRTMMDAIVL